MKRAKGMKKRNLKIKALVEESLERFEKVDSRKGRELAIVYGMKLANTLINKFHISEGLHLSIDRKLNDKLDLVMEGNLTEHEMLDLISAKLRKILVQINKSIN